MAQNLMEHLAGRKCKGFKAAPHYFPTGDFVSLYLKNERCYAQRVDELLTVYLSLDTQELIGCKIKGVRRILETAGDFGVCVDDGAKRLSFLFYAGAIRADAYSGERARRYRDLARMAGHLPIPDEAFNAARGAA